MKKLQLNKHGIAILKDCSMNNIKAGLNAGNTNNGKKDPYGMTSGCTDGCTPFKTAWNCTQKECSHDCLPNNYSKATDCYMCRTR